MSKHSAEFRRHHHLDPRDPGAPTIDMGRPWWSPRAAWPAGVHFEDDPLPLPVTAGMVSSAAELCELSRFAEPEIEDVSG